MRGQTLATLIDNLRAEVGHSTNVAHGVNAEDYLKRTLRRTQEWLWGDWNWPHLLVYRLIPLSRTQRYYSVPADVPFERILQDQVYAKDGDQWRPMIFGIQQPQLFPQYDSDRGDMSWPPTRWDVAEDPGDTAGNIDNFGQIEVWPIPSMDGEMKIRGVRVIRPMVEMSHRCELDGDLLVLYAAAEILARQKATDAEAKGAAAAQRYKMLKAKGSKVKVFSMGAGQQDVANVYPHGPPLPRTGSG
jgi:hypothetical protein